MMHITAKNVSDYSEYVEYRIIYLERNKELGIYCISKTFVLCITYIFPRATNFYRSGADFDSVI
jgi:hypothetical protein